MKTIALICPWYGEHIKGGAEQECNYLAHSLQNVGQKIEVFTTCVKDASSNRGENTLKSGAYTESNILVRRFNVKKQNLDKFIPSNLKIYRNENFTEQDEFNYYSEDINSPEMYEFIKLHKDIYKAFVFIPYLYGITYNGSKVCPDKSILIPCLHDESYAYMNLTREMFESVKGIAYLSSPEKILANQLYNLKNIKNEVLGAGLDTDWECSCDAMRFRKKYGIFTDFILYAGRKDSGKKADELLSFFIKYKEKHIGSSLKLVFLGGGTLPIPDKFKSEIFDLGFVSVEDKHDAFAAATVFCNPSWFESFSIVIMESWVAKRPVIVSSHCEVTKNFCTETNGGFYYENYFAFEKAINIFMEHPEIANRMGKNGHEYVMKNFTHDIIAKKYIDFINSCLNN